MIYNLAMTHVFVFKNDEAAPNLLRVWMMWWAGTEGFRRPEGRGQCGLIRMQWVNDAGSGDAGDGDDADDADSGDSGLVVMVAT